MTGSDCVHSKTMNRQISGCRQKLPLNKKYIKYSLNEKHYARSSQWVLCFFAGEHYNFGEPYLTAWYHVNADHNKIALGALSENWESYKVLVPGHERRRQPPCFKYRCGVSNSQMWLSEDHNEPYNYNLQEQSGSSKITDAMPRAEIRILKV